MPLADTYASIVKPTIVAFVQGWTHASPDGQTPKFVEIIGTGFVVGPAGLVVTNRHVAAVLNDVPREIRGKVVPSLAMLLRPDAQGLHTPLVEILGSHVPIVPDHYLTPYAPGQPDIALVQIAARGLDAVEIGDSEQIREGELLATAGYSGGTAALTPDGHLAQLTPMLQQGIVSAVLPFPCEDPSGFVLNVMIRGGASGSPVFLPETGAVVGVLHSSLNDVESDGERGSLYVVPTNCSYGLPAHVIRIVLDEYLGSGKSHDVDDLPDLAELLRNPEGRTPGVVWNPFW